MKIIQFEVWQINLNPSKGSEQKGIRPCIILQTNAANDYGESCLTQDEPEMVSEFSRKMSLKKLKFDILCRKA